MAPDPAPRTPVLSVELAIGPSAITEFLGEDSDAGLDLDNVYTFELRAAYHVTPAIAIVGGVGAWIELPSWGTEPKQRDARYYETVVDAAVRTPLGGRFWGSAGLALMFDHRYEPRALHVGWEARVGVDLLQRERGALALSLDWLAAPTDDGLAGGVFGIVRLGCSIADHFDTAW